MTIFVEVAAVDDIPPGTMRGFDHGGQKYIVVNLDGAFYAIGGICSHAYAELADGYLAGDQVVCPFHASAFEVQTGAVVGPPADRPIPTFATAVRDGKVYLVLD